MSKQQYTKKGENGSIDADVYVTNRLVTNVGTVMFCRTTSA